jgi:hypothetical protein
MGSGLIGKEYFCEQLRYHKKKFAWCRKYKRALNKIVKKIGFFKRYAQAFGVAVIFLKKTRRSLSQLRSKLKTLAKKSLFQSLLDISKTWSITTTFITRQASLK